MPHWILALQIIKEILMLLRDTDNDGAIDIFDTEPDNPEVQ